MNREDWEHRHRIYDDRKIFKLLNHLIFKRVTCKKYKFKFHDFRNHFILSFILYTYRSVHVTWNICKFISFTYKRLCLYIKHCSAKKRRLIKKNEIRFFTKGCNLQRSYTYACISALEINKYKSNRC